jgi:hypothetical protein
VTDNIDAVAMILKRHPHGVSMAQLINGLTGPGCTRTEAQQIARNALAAGRDEA